MKGRHWVRWLLVVPAAWVAWALAVSIAFALYNLLERLCPPEYIVSGTCTAPWFRAAEPAIFCMGAGLAAAAIVVSCTLVAPSHRHVVSVVTFLTGVVVALMMAIAADGFAEFVTAVLVGLAVTWWLRRRVSRPAPRTQTTLSD